MTRLQHKSIRRVRSPQAKMTVLSHALSRALSLTLSLSLLGMSLSARAEAANAAAAIATTASASASVMATTSNTASPNCMSMSTHASAQDPLSALLPDTLALTLTSSVNGQRYPIWIHKPSASIAVPPHGFPILYVLDGNATFVLAAQAARLQERLIGGVIVVGIGTPGDALFDPPARYRDLTTPAPPGTWGVPLAPNGKAIQTGGANAFLDLLDTTLPAAIDACLHPDKTRTTLFGHSLAGFFVLHSLFTRPDSFQHYIAASPSIWWNDRQLLREPIAVHSASTKTLALMVGGAEQTLAADASSKRVDRVTHAAMDDNVQRLYAHLSDGSEQHLHTSLQVFDGANHISYLPAALSAAVTAAAMGESKQP